MMLLMIFMICAKNKDDLFNIIFECYANKEDMRFDYYLTQPKSMFTTTLIKNLARYPEKLKILEPKKAHYYQCLLLKYGMYGM